MKVWELLLVISAAIAVAVFLIGYLYSLRYVFQYEVEKDALRIKLFGFIPVRRVRLDDVDEIALITWRETVPLSKGFRFPFLIAERWPSYVFQKRGVYLRKKTGVIRFLILSPKDPQGFVRKLRNSSASDSAAQRF